MEGRIAFLPGDGIGPEVLGEARRVLEAIGEAYGHRFEIVEGVMGAGAVESAGDPLPGPTRELVTQVDAVLLGAVGFATPPTDPTVPDAAKGLLDLRKLLGNYANIRPVAVPDAILNQSPFRAEHIRGVDLVVVRELLGGIYFGLPRGLDHGIAHNTEVYTEEEVRRITKMAFEIARNAGTRWSRLIKRTFWNRRFCGAGSRPTLRANMPTSNSAACWSTTVRCN